MLPVTIPPRAPYRNSVPSSVRNAATETPPAPRFFVRSRICSAAASAACDASAAAGTTECAAPDVPAGGVTPRDAQAARVVTAAALMASARHEITGQVSGVDLHQE